MSSWLADLAHGCRSLLRTPWLFAGLTVVLALGTGANTAMFSLVQATLLAPMPYRQPADVVMVWNARHTPTRWRLGATVDEIVAWKDGSGMALSDVAAVKLAPGTREAMIDLVLQDRAERLRGGIVTSNFFEILGVSAAIGRVFSPDDEAAGRLDGVVISHNLWQRAFGSDPGIVGRHVALTTGDGHARQSRAYLVAGVLPPQFKFTYPLETEVWLMESWASVRSSPKYALMFQGAVARLKPGVPLATANARMADVPRRQADVPLEKREFTKLEPVADWVVGGIRPSVGLLAVASVILLLVTCATIASAILVRWAQAHREYAIRAALGCDRLRLARHAAGEAMVLAVTGAGTGFLLAVATLPTFRALVPSVVSRGDDIAVNVHLVVAAAVITGIVALLASLLPALQAARVDTAVALTRGSSAMSPGPGTTRLQAALVFAQTAIATALLIVSALLVASFWRLGRVDLGFDGESVLTVEMRLLEARYATPESRRRLQGDLLARVRAIPGVLEAGLTTAVPFRGVDWTASLPPQAGGRRVVANARMVDESFFPIMNIGLLKGRLLESSDRPESPRVAVVSESFSRAMFGDIDPIGRTFEMDGRVEVVGVVRDVRYVSADQQPQPAFYLSRRQQPSDLMCLVVRTAPSVANLSGAVRAAIHEVDPTLPPMNVTTVDQIVSESLADRRFYTIITAAFAMIALLLIATSLAVIVARTAVERRRELAIRTAIGADRNRLMILVARQAVVPALAGVATGLVAAWLGSVPLERFMFQVSPRASLVYVAAAALVVAIAVASSLVPAYKLAGLEPAAVLRGE